MFETLFLNPANMVVGGALISSPIIIHLINRMRFRRIRWAAMEFLLKSQKRNRRRLIIEQLILLLLRILLVLLAGLLLARYLLGISLAGLFQPQNTVHLILLDDRLSMTDHSEDEDGQVQTAFEGAKQLIETKIVKEASQARTPQHIILLKLSEPATALFEKRLSEETQRELTSTLAQLEEPTMLHLDLVQGLKAARTILDKHSQDERLLHVVSDFRSLHWNGPDAAGLRDLLKDISQAGVKINLVDAAYPYRTEAQRQPAYSDNLAISELRAEVRVAVLGMPVPFTVKVTNYSLTEKKNVKVTIKVDGVERNEGTLTIPSLLPGTKSESFQMLFNRFGYNRITAQLENEKTGLQADNLRYAVIDVRRQVPVLFIDGDFVNGDQPGRDSFNLKATFASTNGYEVTRRDVRELETANLDQYASVYLLNVAKLSPKGLANLDTYVRQGGSVAFFLGEKVDPDYYNKTLYAGGEGLFPAPLASSPTQSLKEEEKIERRFDNQYKLYVRNEAHPIFADLFKVPEERQAVLDFLRFLVIDRYFPVQRLKWNKSSGDIEELMTLPNRRALDEYKDEAKEIVRQVPVEDQKYATYRPGLESRMRNVSIALEGKSLQELAAALDMLLHDRGDNTDPQRPNLEKFWEQPELKELRQRFEAFHDLVRYGDPFMIARRLDKGRVVAIMTSAGQQWNNWAGEFPVSATFPMLVLELQRYLNGTYSDPSQIVGTPRDIQVDSSRFEPEVLSFLWEEKKPGAQGKPVEQEAPAADPNKPVAETLPSQDPTLEKLGKETGTVSGTRLNVLFTKTQKPGIYFFELTQRTEPGADPKKETRAYAFNVDTASESDLARTSSDQLEQAAPGVAVSSAEAFKDLASRRKDLSESPWFFLFFLVILIIEQALAVHLSFHLRGNEAGLPTQAVRPQASAA